MLLDVGDGVSEAGPGFVVFLLFDSFMLLIELDCKIATTIFHGL